MFFKLNILLYLRNVLFFFYGVFNIEYLNFLIVVFGKNERNLMSV